MLRLLRSGFPRASFPFVLALLLSACIDSHGIAPEATPLDANALAGGRDLAAAERSAGWPQEAWWQAYGDPQLDAWMERALAGSPNLAAAAARVRQARALAGVVEADEAPQLNLDASVQRKRWPDDNFYGPGPLAGSSSWNNTSELGFRYALDLWGRERSRSAQALSRAQLTAAEARAARLELQGNLLRAYVRFALLFAERDILIAELTQQEQILTLAERRRLQGIGTGLDVSRAEAPLPDTHRRLDALDEELALARHQLAALAGEGPAAGDALARPTLALQHSPGLPAQLPLELLGRRPDLVARRWQIAAAARGIEVAKAGFYPNVDLLGGLGSAAVQGGVLDFLRHDKLSAGFGPALSLPIFDGGRLRSELGAASADYDLAVADYDQTLIQALRSVADAVTRLHSLDAQAELSAAAVARAQRSCDLARLAQQRGLTDYDAVLASLPLLFKRQRQQQRVHAARLTAQADLLLALGGGVLPSGAGPDAAALQPVEPTLR